MGLEEVWTRLKFSIFWMIFMINKIRIFDDILNKVIYVWAMFALGL